MIKSYEQFISENHNNYIYLNRFDEFIYEDRIDEGFKDFIRKAAISVAVATSCLTSMAAPKTQPASIEIAKSQIEHKIDKLNQQYKSAIHFAIGAGEHSIDAMKSSRQQIIDYVKEKTGSKHVDDAMINKMIGVVSVTSYSPESDNGEWCQIIYFIDRTESEDTDQEQSYINDCEKEYQMMDKWFL
jgi:hypothetical protein